MYPFERFTERTKQIFTLAQEEAERSHHSYIGTEHVLLALLREPGGLAGKILRGLGVEETAVRASIESVLGRNERIIIQQIIPTSRVKKVIEIAHEQAKAMGHNYVGTEHLLLGLLIEGEGIAAHVLEDSGVTLAAVQARLQVELYGRQDDSPFELWWTATYWPLHSRYRQISSLEKEVARDAFEAGRRVKTPNVA